MQTGPDTPCVQRNRPPELLELYAALEAFVKSLGPVELVTRDRYVLLRTQRIFTDLVIMSDAIRVAIHLPHKIESALFIKVVADRRHVTHVAKLRSKSELDAVKPFVREAYTHSLA